jgi:hypothetical protein
MSWPSVSRGELEGAEEGRALFPGTPLGTDTNPRGQGQNVNTAAKYQPEDG